MTDNHYPLDPNIIRNARELRRHGTRGEAFLWQLLRNRRFEGIKFRRQAPWPPYTLDFFAPKLKLVIELDGDQHAERTAEDRYRDQVLANAGIITLRFPNEELVTNLEGVLNRIWMHARDRMP